MTISSFRSARWLGGVSIVAAVALAGCHNILDVQYPGQIPTSQINDPSLAAVLVRSVIGDFECAYSNYMSGSSVHSDEYETANSNVPLANWGERTITADENDYAIGTCEGNFGMNLTLHTARFQAEDVSTKLAGWTDQQVPGRVSLQAQAKIYAAYAYLLMGEGFCQVAFDGGAAQPPTAALTLAETRFTEGLAFAQQAGNTDMLDLGRVGMARAKLDLKKWSEAAQFASQVTTGYTKNADRGVESNRRWNKLWIGDLETDREKLIARSPITYIDNVRCPLLVIQGDNDRGADGRVHGGDGVSDDERSTRAGRRRGPWRVQLRGAALDQQEVHEPLESDASGEQHRGEPDPGGSAGATGPIRAGDGARQQPPGGGGPHAAVRDDSSGSDRQYHRRATQGAELRGRSPSQRSAALPDRVEGGVEPLHQSELRHDDVLAPSHA